MASITYWLTIAGDTTDKVTSMLTPSGFNDDFGGDTLDAFRADRTIKHTDGALLGEVKLR